MYGFEEVLRMVFIQSLCAFRRAALMGVWSLLRGGVLKNPSLKKCSHGNNVGKPLGGSWGSLGGVLGVPGAS